MFRFDRESLKARSPQAFAEQRSVRFQDVDAAGLVFYPRILEYFHDLYVSFLAHIGSPLDRVLDERAWIAPVRHAEADYLRPLRFGDVVELALVRVHLESTEVTLGFRAAELKTSRVCVVAQTVHTFVDPVQFRRCNVPPHLCAAFAALAV